MPKNPELSVIILNYNTKDLLEKCLVSLARVKNEVNFEVIVSDNGSRDGSLEMLNRDFKWVKVIKNSKNLGFAKGNNQARNTVKGEYVLFLNSDTQILPGTLAKSISYIDSRHRVGALTCKIVLPNGDLDKDTRRSFPIPWISFTHFSGLDRLFPKSKFLARYWYGYINPNVIHEIDVLQGAFFLVRKNVLDEVGWFDEDYFLDGEDVDLCWKIRERGWKIIYFPGVSVLHLKKATKDNLGINERRKYITLGVKSMEIFYRKHLWKRYPYLVNLLVLFGIRLMGIIRSLKVAFRLKI